MQKPLLILALVAIAWTSSRPARMSDDDAAIRRVIADNSAAFNKRDPTGLAAHVTSETDHIGVRGDWVSGKTALEKNLIEYFKNPDQPTTKDAVQQIRFIKPDVAIVIVKRTYWRPTDTRDSIATYVMQRIGSDWQIAAFQNTFVQ